MKQIELVIEVPEGYDDIHIDLCVEDMHINEHFKIISVEERKEKKPCPDFQIKAG